MGYKAENLTMRITIFILVSASRSLKFFQLYKN